MPDDLYPLLCLVPLPPFVVPVAVRAFFVSEDVCSYSLDDAKSFVYLILTLLCRCTFW